MNPLENLPDHSAEFKKLQAAMLASLPSLESFYRGLEKWKDYYEVEAKKILDSIDYDDLERISEHLRHWNREWFGVREDSNAEPPIERKIIRGFAPEPRPSE